MTTSPKAHALLYRIWAFAKEREWNVTVTEIAEALGESWQRVRKVMQDADWLNRVRKASPAPEGFASHNAGLRCSERFVVADVLAGRVEAGTL
jgi:predicted transcriptional regulator